MLSVNNILRVVNALVSEKLDIKSPSIIKLKILINLIHI